MGLLPFQEEILDQITKADRGLWVVESGLGLHSVLLHYIVRLEKRNSSRLLYLVLNPDPQVPVFDRLIQMAPHRYKLVNSEFNADQRYAKHVLCDALNNPPCRSPMLPYSPM